MHNDAFELIGVAVEPIHQVTAVAGSRGRLTMVVDEGIPVRRFSDPLKNFLAGPAKNVPLDIIGELFAKTG